MAKGNFSNLLRAVPAGRTDAPALVLAAAFQDDPLFVHAMPDAVPRASALPLCFRACARQAIQKGCVDTAERDGVVVGTALWLPGEDPEVGWTEVVTQGHADIARACGPRAALRLMRLQDQISRRHKELVDEPHDYLFGIGVRPGQQGRGVGSELLTRGIARSEASGRSCYLETNLERNVVLYRRHGFQVLAEEDDHGFHAWFMLRPLGG